MSELIVDDIVPWFQIVLTAGQTNVDVPFSYLVDSGVAVWNDGVELTLTTDYTVNNAGTEGPYSLTLVSAAVGGETLTIKRATPNARLTDFKDSGDWTAANVNKELDRLTMVDQELADKFSKTITAQEFDSTRSLVLPLLASCKGKALIFDKTSGDLTVSTADFEDAALYASNASSSAAAALASQNAAAASQSASHTSELNAAASAAAAALNVVSAAMGPVCSAATLAAGRTAFDVYSKGEADTLLAAKAPSASPAFTGAPTSPTAPAGTNTTQLATTAYVDRSIEQIATCGTASATAAKIASVTNSNFVLQSGARVLVSFVNANTVAGPLTLNVNGTGDIAIRDENDNVLSSVNPAYFPSSSRIEFIYDGSCWRFRNSIVSSYTNGNTWYRVFSNGWRQQGGYATSKGTITTPIAHLSTNYNIQCTMHDSGGAYFDRTIYAAIATNSTFVTYIGGNGSNNGYDGAYFWRTEGF